MVADVDAGTQSLAIRALGAWGDDQSRTVLIGRLGEPDFRPVREAIEALGKLGPDVPAARAIAGRLAKDRRTAIEVLASMGPTAEDAALEALGNASKDGFLRSDLYRLLGQIGSEVSLPALREAAGQKNSEAQNALKIIELRTRGPGVLALLPDLRSADGTRRREAIQRIAIIPPDAANAAMVARALDLMWDIDDSFMKKPLREAVAHWGDNQSADLLADRLARPHFKGWEEALPALVKLRPDETTAGLLAARFGQNPGLVTSIAGAMPLEAERALLGIVKNESDPKLRSEACKALGTIGTPASVPDLQALAGRAGDVQIAREAEDALKAITARQ